jgi:hypothetical protein
MSQDEIIKMLNISGLGKILMLDEYGVVKNEPIKAFTKLVEAHTRGKILKPDWTNYRQGLVDGALAEREACAEVCLKVKYDPASGVRESFATAIRNRNEETL